MSRYTAASGGKKTLSFILSVVMILMMFLAATPTGAYATTNYDFIVPVTHQTTVPGGYTGIYTPAQLDALRDDAPGGQYILMNNIDLSGYANWVPIGTQSSPFSGTLDGNGYVIRNIYVETSGSYAGLFGYVGDSTSILNLGIEQSEINSSSLSIGTNTGVGGLVGYFSSSLTITNCYNTGAVTSHTRTGGLVGGNYSNASSAIIIENSYNTGIVTSYSNSRGTGGLLGGCDSTTLSGPPSKTVTIENCNNAGAVTFASGFTGGLVGSAESTGSASSAESRSRWSGEEFAVIVATSRVVLVFFLCAV
jgi:hypothetical protein